MSDLEKIITHDGKMPSMGGMVFKAPFGEAPAGGDVYKPVQDLPSDPEENIIYYKMSGDTGEYNTVNRATSGEELFYKVVPYMGLPVTVTYIPDQVCYRVQIPVPGHALDFVLPLAFCDKDAVMSSGDIAGCFQQVYTREEADMHVYYGNNPSVGNNLMIPIDMEPADLPEESYVRLHSSKRNNLSVDTTNNSFIYNAMNYKLNEDPTILNNYFLNRVANNNVFECPTNRDDADFIFNYKKVITNFDMAFPIGCSVHGSAQYMYTAYYRDSQWHYINYAVTNDWISEDEIKRPVSAQFFSEQINLIRQDYEPVVIYTTELQSIGGYDVPVVDLHAMERVIQSAQKPVIFINYNQSAMDERHYRNVITQNVNTGGIDYANCYVQLLDCTVKYSLNRMTSEIETTIVS